MNKKNLQKLLALLLCAGLVCAAPASVLPAYALTDADEQVDEQAEDQETPVAEETPPESTAPNASSSNAYEQQISKLDSELDKLAAEKKRIQAEINSITGTKEKAQAEKSHLDSQIYIIQSEISLLEERILLLEGDIELTDLRIRAKQAEHDYNFEQFRQRLRAMQMSSNTSLLGLALGADDFSDYLTKSDAAVRVATHDREMMDNLSRERAELEAEKEKLEDTKTAAESDRLVTQDKKQELAVRQREASLRVQDLAEQEREFRENLAANQAREREVQAEIDRIYQQISWDTNPYVGGEMAWPVPGYSNVTSNYGWRWNKTDLHTGMDISGSNVYGKNIVAANSGKVVKVNWTFTQGRGYGIFLMIDHGGGLSTVYAHCSNIYVKEGDVVTRGQTIAAVGSTGWSTGPHLHFEVRINGVHTNPKAYLY